MRNGYALCTPSGLSTIESRLERLDDGERSTLRDLLRIGVHWRVEVTESAEPGRSVSQAFCSALPVSYTDIPAERWTAFATLVLEGAYEATLWAAVLNAAKSTSNVIYLTELGGGAFGNRISWIHGAMRRGLEIVRGLALDVRLVSYRAESPGLSEVSRQFA
jgi:hypothetical protein